MDFLPATLQTVMKLSITTSTKYLLRIFMSKRKGYSDLAQGKLFEERF